MARAKRGFKARRRRNRIRQARQGLPRRPLQAVEGDGRHGSPRLALRHVAPPQAQAGLPRAVDRPHQRRRAHCTASATRSSSAGSSAPTSSSTARSSPTSPSAIRPPSPRSWSRPRPPRSSMEGDFHGLARLTISSSFSATSPTQLDAAANGAGRAQGLRRFRRGQRRASVCKQKELLKAAPNAEKKAIGQADQRDPAEGRRGLRGGAQAARRTRPRRAISRAPST